MKNSRKPLKMPRAPIAPKPGVPGHVPGPGRPRKAQPITIAQRRGPGRPRKGNGGEVQAFEGDIEVQTPPRTTSYIPPHESSTAPLHPAIINDIPELFPAITDRRQRAFLCAFAAHGDKERAAGEVGVDARLHRVWLTRDVAYSTAFAEAEAVLADRLEDAMMRRGADGTVEETYFMGMLSSRKIKYSDSFVQFGLTHLRPERYGKAAGQGESLSDAMAAMLSDFESRPPVPSAPIGSVEGEEAPWEQHPSIEETADEEEELDGEDEDDDDEEFDATDDGEFLDGLEDDEDNPFQP